MRLHFSAPAAALALALAGSFLGAQSRPSPLGGATLFWSADEAGAAAKVPSEASFAHPASLPSPGRLPDTADRAFLLCWHTFLGKPDIPTDFSIDELSRQVDALLGLGYRFISLEDLLFGRFEGRMNLVATMDDGHRTVPAACAKVFAARGIVPAVFVYPAVIGATSYSMDAAQLRSLRDAGCLVGAHGYYHLFVTEALYRSDRAAFEKEIFTAKSRVESMSELPAYAYAYPFGALSPVTKREVARAGYAFGIAVKPGFVYADPRLNDPYELPRSVVTRDNWDALLAFLARNASGKGEAR